MAARTYELAGTCVMECEADGPPLRTERDAVDLIGEALSHGAQLVVIPVSRLTDDFFQLRTRLAGDIVQKFVNYGLRLAIVGDISRHLTASEALRAFVREASRGEQLQFVADLGELRTDGLNP